MWPDGASSEVFYRGIDNHVHALTWKPTATSPLPGPIHYPPGDWHSAGDLTLATLAPRVVSGDLWSAMSSYVRPDGDSEHVFYVAADGGLHEFVRSATSDWSHVGPLATVFIPEPVPSG